MLNASSPVLNESLRRLSKAETQHLEKIKESLKKDIQSTNNNTLYWTNN